MPALTMILSYGESVICQLENVQGLYCFPEIVLGELKQKSLALILLEGKDVPS